ncbi:diguanylate cyclase domain-containing protein [Actinotalea sp. K2]|uniref:diguanylate cyclase domain-containing protein n=1 Tax=Actinotalea sp. K2 TaxID=2939438 RepID=UPI002016D3BE|nr:diguanylate cyclase [Actinotalea sp. K2]MCL3861847.1 diguanylate cyclase [Actinotalea sp. K2]
MTGAGSAGDAPDAFDACPLAIVGSDTDGCVSYWNASAETLFGMPAGRAVGARLADLFVLTNRDPTGRFPEREWARMSDGALLPVESVRWVAHGAGPTTIWLLLQDARHRAAYEHERDRTVARLWRQARSDPLTGLANRYEFEERLAEAISVESGTLVALAVIDLDGFKPINDTHGHAVGDEVLVGVSERLRSMTRSTDTVARLGGDEFAVLTRLRGGRSLERFTERMSRALSGEVATAAGRIAVQVSVGAALAEPGAAPIDLVRRADKAMYLSKITKGPGAQSRPPRRRGVSTGELTTVT